MRKVLPKIKSLFDNFSSRPQEAQTEILTEFTNSVMWKLHSNQKILAKFSADPQISVQTSELRSKFDTIFVNLKSLIENSTLERTTKI
jgi:hypothetical protein